MFHQAHSLNQECDFVDFPNVAQPHNYPIIVSKLNSENEAIMMIILHWRKEDRWKYLCHSPPVLKNLL